MSLHSQRQPLPDYFVSPPKLCSTQPELFTQTLSEVMHDLDISFHDIECWRQNGWLSFDPQETDAYNKYADERIWEIQIVRDIARSGLSVQDQELLLDALPKPFQYNPHKLVYSFMFGWVEVNDIEPDPDSIIEEHLEDWLSNQEPDVLNAIGERIQEIMDCGE